MRAKRLNWKRKLLALCVSCLRMGLPAQAAAQSPTAEEVMQRMQEHNAERLSALERYESERTYQVLYTGTGGEHKAELKVHAEYVGPDQKRFNVVGESGSKFICDKVLRKLVEGEAEAADRSNRMQSQLNLDNYTATIAGEETLDQLGGGAPVKTWVLKVTPRSPNKFTYRGTVWISEDDYAVMRIAGEPAKSPSMWIDKAHFDSRYIKRGQVWLPGHNVSSSHVRIGGQATLTIDYGSYPVVAARPIKQSIQTAAVDTTFHN